jgi:eukaryotic-like serine/threonine-protein kinase
MRSHAELLEASGYGSRPKDFDDLIRILDSEIRLITPTDPEGKDADDDSVTQDPSGAEVFSTDARLSGAFAAGLADPQAEGNPQRPGRTQAVRYLGDLERQAGKPLPAVAGGVAEHSHADRQETLDRAAAGHDSASRSIPPVPTDGSRCAAGTDHRERLVDVASCGPESTQIAGAKGKGTGSDPHRGLVGRLVSAEPNQLPGVIEELDANSEIATTYLSPLLTQQAETLDEKRSQLHARLATVARDKSLVEPLLEELLTNKVAYIGPIRQQLRPYAGELTEKLWAILRDENDRSQSTLPRGSGPGGLHSRIRSGFRGRRGPAVCRRATGRRQMPNFSRCCVRICDRSAGDCCPSLETIFGDPKRPTPSG